MHHEVIFVESNNFLQKLVNNNCSLMFSESLTGFHYILSALKRVLSLCALLKGYMFTIVMTARAY